MLINFCMGCLLYFYLLCNFTADAENGLQVNDLALLPLSCMKNCHIRCIHQLKLSEFLCAV
jgi:hypothetical protein